MIAQIFNSRSGAGGAATISYAFGQTSHKDEHAASECTFLTSNLLVIPDPTIRFELDELGRPELSRIPASQADVSPIIEQFEDLASRNERVQDPYFHAMLSFSPEDEQKIDERMMKEITHQFMSDMGFDDAAWVATVHRDTAHTHIHLAACTVQNLPGNPVVPAWNNYQRAMESVRQIEADYGLAAVHMPEQGQRIDGRETRKTAHELRDIIDQCVSETCEEHNITPSQGPGSHSANGGPDSTRTPLATFVDKLQEFGVDVQFQFKEGKPSGISYSLDDSSWSGGKLRGGGRFTLPGLERRGISYSDADKSMCERVTAESKERRESGVVLTASRLIEECAKPAGAAGTAGKGGYPDAEPHVLLKLDSDIGTAVGYKMSPCPPHYAVFHEKTNTVSSYWRLGVSRASVNCRGYDAVDELLARIRKKQREIELNEMIDSAQKMSLVTRGLAPGQNLGFCSPRPGAIPSTDDRYDPEKAEASVFLWF